MDETQKEEEMHLNFHKYARFYFKSLPIDNLMNFQKIRARLIVKPGFFYENSLTNVRLRWICISLHIIGQ